MMPLKPVRALMVALVAMLAVGACKDEEKPKAAVPVFVPVETFTINLQPPQSSYLHTTFELKVHSQEVAEKIKVYMPELRNGAIFLLSTRQGAELVSNEGKQKLGSDLAAMMNGLLGRDGLKDAVQAVNFTSFIIQ